MSLDMDMIPTREELEAEAAAGHSNGINMNYLSPSTINSYIERRNQWFHQKVARDAKFEPSPNMARGTAIEHAINCWIETGESSNMNDLMMEKYQEELKEWFKTAGQKALEKEKEIVATMPRILEKAHSVFDVEFCMHKPLTQAKISCRLPNTTLDILGYMDYFRSGKLVNDLKIVSKTPSGLSQGYIIQGALYRFATGCPVTFNHFIPQVKEVKHEPITLSDEEYNFGISYATKAVQCLEALQVETDPAKVIKLMAFPNLSSYWTYEEKADVAARYGIKLR